MKIASKIKFRTAEEYMTDANLRCVTLHKMLFKAKVWLKVCKSFFRFEETNLAYKNLLMLKLIFLLVSLGVNVPSV